MTNIDVEIVTKFEGFGVIAGRDVIFSRCSDIELVDVVVCGHSHATAVSTSMIDGAYCGDGKVGGLVGGNAVPSRNPLDPYWEKVKLLAPQRTIAVSWLGNEHFIDFLFSPDGDFDFVVDEDDADALESGKANLIPLQLVREHFLPSLSELGELIEQLKVCGAERIVLLGTPPPRADKSHVQAHLPTEPLFGGLLEKLGLTIEEAPITPLPTLIKLWRVSQELLREVAAEHGVVFFEVVGAQDANGALKEEYWHYDLTHANTHYGAELVKQLVDHLQLRPEG